MDITLIGALVSGAFVILAVLLEYALHLRSERKIVIPKGRGRIDSLLGRWEGEAFDVDVPDEKKSKYKNTYVFEKKRGLIRGRVEYSVMDSDTKNVLVFVGGFYNESYLKLEYRNADETVLQYGVMILRLSSDGRKISGKFLGYGFRRESIVEGHIELTKTE